MHKMFTLCSVLAVLHLTIAAVGTFTENPDITLISEWDGWRNKLKMWCIVNDSTAVTWTRPDSISEDVSEFYPKTAEKFSCKLDVNDSCIDYWIKEPWYLTNSATQYFGPILDRRWEAFEIHVTENRDDKNQTLHFVQVATLQNVFSVAFSVKNKYGAQVLICDGLPENSTCYWFIIGGWNGKTSALRKCGRGKIPMYSKVYPRLSCKTFRASVNHSNKNPLPLQENEWKNFIIAKDDAKISLTHVGSETPLLSYLENKQIDNNNLYMFLNSRFVEGLWKIHLYDFLYSEKSSTTLLGPVIHPFKKYNDKQATYYICVKMFVVMCDECYFTLRFWNQRNQYEKTFQSKESSRWKEIKFMQDNVEFDDYFMHVITYNKNIKGFWAIDDVRQCANEEVRVSTTEIGYYDKIACQVLQYPTKTLHLIEANKNKIENDCPTGTFGKYCTSCELVFGQESNLCEKKNICTYPDKSDYICQCAAGYSSDLCDYECPYNHYGFACQNKCGKCYSGECNKVTGFCNNNGCDNGFVGNLCKIPSSVPILASPPNKLEVGNTFCKIVLPNTEVVGNLTKPTHYILQISTTIYGWKDVDIYHLTDTSPKLIQNLNISTVYYIRAVLASTQGKKYESNEIPFIKLETTCIPITKQDVNIIPSDFSAQIKIQLLYVETCSIDEYQVYLDNRKIIFTAAGSSNLSHLQPYKNYTLKFYRSEIENFEVHFTTLESKPSEIININVTKRNATSITLEWGIPLHPNGIIRYYTMQYWYIGNLGCEDNHHAITEKQKNILDNLKNTFITLSNLEPYSEYNIELYATTLLNGDPVTIQVTTLASDEIDQKELPISVNATPQETSVSIQLIQTPCEYRKGPLLLEVTATCLNQWCDESSNNRYLTMPMTLQLFEISNLLPYSDYNLNINFKRFNNRTLKNLSLDTNFKTLPGVTYSVRNISIYSQTKHEVFISWLPPFPPTGVLMSYKVTYSIIYYVQKYQKYEYAYFEPKICPIWNDKHCVEIGNLHESYQYVIKVYSKNYGVEDYNFQIPTPHIIKPVEIAESSIPKNFVAHWSEDNHLTLSWIHPDFTSGFIHYFQICVKGQGIEKYELYNLADYNSYNTSYRYKITTLPLSRKYTIAINAVTSLNYGYQNTIQVYSPPETPALTADPFILETVNKTIKLFIPPYDEKKSNSLDISYLFVILSEDKLFCADRNKLHADIINKANCEAIKSCIVIEKSLKQITPGVTLTVGEHQPVLKSHYLETLDILEEPLQENAYYNISILLVNEFGGKRKHRLYSLNSIRLGHKAFSNEEMETSSKLWILAFLLLLPVPILCWILKRKESLNITCNYRRRVVEETVLEDKLSPDVIPLSNVNIPRKVPNNITSVVSNNIHRKPVYSKVIKITDLEPYIKEAIASGELERQHQTFRRGNTNPCEYGELKPNKLKNRYNNLVAYDHTRVQLAKINSDEYSDYINANYINGFHKSKAYIATQGPKVSTVDDFWRMIWQEHVNNIVMLANVYESGKKKCEKYWPSFNENLQFGSIQVKYVSSELFVDYEYRLLEASCGGESRLIEQLHFTSWPDHGVPLYSQTLVPFLSKLSRIQYGSPIVVHCSAGVGRTGTIILCDICLRMGTEEGVVDLYGTLQNLREQRVNMVDNVDQYKLAHLVLLEYLVSPCTTIPCDDMMESTIERLLISEGIEEQMRYLQNTLWQDEAMLNVDKCIQKSMHFREKNRFQEIVPDTYGRVFLLPFPVSDESSTYINAVTVDGYRSPGNFLVTQQPLSNTLGDFWRLITEKDVSLIVSLNTFETNDKTICRFWPTKNQPELCPVSYITLKYLDEIDAIVYRIIYVDVSLHNKENINYTVRILMMKGWNSNAILPMQPENLILLCEEISRNSRNDKPILVSCYDGATASGLIVALAFVIEKMKLEQECDVCLAVRTVRRYRKQFVTNHEQYKFLYKAAIKYVSEFETYSNFISAVKN